MKAEYIDENFGPVNMYICVYFWILRIQQSSKLAYKIISLLYWAIPWPIPHEECVVGRFAGPN